MCRRKDKPGRVPAGMRHHRPAVREGGVWYIDRYLMEVRHPDALTGRYEVLPDTRLIADEAFEGCTALTEVVLPEGLATIGGRAFYGCTGLASFRIPEGVEMIRGGTDGQGRDKKLKFSLCRVLKVSANYRTFAIGKTTRCQLSTVNCQLK